MFMLNISLLFLKFYFYWFLLESTLMFLNSDFLAPVIVHQKYAIPHRHLVLDYF